MRCAPCGTENPDRAKFCLECGAPLARRCPACGGELPRNAKFCVDCGAVVGESPAQEARKVVTVVFADLAGSTGLHERMDAESVRRVMDRFYAAMRAQVDGHGGRVVNTGDGLMAAFGVPDVREDDALRAVRAAAGMQDALVAVAEEVERDRGAKVALRVGVNTGEVVVSEDDDDVVGDAVNVASRLERAAQSGQVLVGEETWRLIRHAMTLEPVPPLALRGKADPVRAFRLVSLDAAGPQPAATPFVGRAAELSRLLALFEECVAARAPRLVTVIGSPGLGKTRLATELGAALADRAGVAEVRCDPAGAATFAPIADAIRVTARISETATAGEVVAAVSALLPDEPDRDRVVTAIAALLGAAGAASPQETFWGVRRMFETAARVRPVVLVMDDVHWAEPMLLDLVEHLAEWSRDAPVLLLALARPEIRETRPSLTETGARASAVLVLQGLDPESTSRLARDLLGAHDLPGDLVRKLLATSEGNPLFLRELLRMLVEDGVLRREGDRWAATLAADAIEVPPTINALLSARLERLGTDERTVVERASVIGKEFYRGAVLELVPAQLQRSVDAHLETLRRQSLIDPEGTYWIDEPVFRFHHALIRDAAYRRLLKEARAELHERFADWLEAKVGDFVSDHGEVIGYHLEQAHEYIRQLGPLDARAHDLGRRAAAHLASAARRALERDDVAAAAALSGRALERMAGDDPARPEVLIDRCEALLATGDVVAGAIAVEELEQLGRRTDWAECFRARIAILTDPSRLTDTAARVAAAAERFTAAGDLAGAAAAYEVQANALARLGRFGPCEIALDRALSAARQAGDRRRANAVLARAPVAALWGPSPVARASGRCLDIVRVLRITAGAPAVEATALRCQAVLEALRGRFGASRRMLASANATLEDLGLRNALLESDVAAGIVELLSGGPSAAESLLRRARDGFAALGNEADAGQAAALLARACLAQHRPEEAEALTRESERLGGDDLKTAIAWRSVRAEALAARGDIESALTLAHEAASIAERTDALVDHADARRSLALVLHAAGRGDEAARESLRVSELLERKRAVHAPDDRPRPGGVHTADVAPPAFTAALERFRAAMHARDWDAVAEAFSPDAVWIDHRRGVGAELRGREAVVDGYRPFAEREHDWWFEILESRDDHVVLLRTRTFGAGLAGGGDWDRVVLAVNTLDGDGRFASLEIFDESALDDARHRFLALAPKPAPIREIVAAMHAAYNARDWDRFPELFRDDMLVVDHRPVGWGEVRGAEGLLEISRGALSTAREAWLYEREWRVLGAHSALLEYTLTGQLEAGGGEFDLGRLAVVSERDGRLSRFETFDLAQELEARQRLHEIDPSPEQVRWFVDRYVAAYNARDFETIERLFSRDIRVNDERPLGWGRFDGLPSLLDRLREGLRGAPDAVIDVDLVDTRDRSATFRQRMRGTLADGGGAFELDRVMVFAMDAGRVTAAHMLEPDADAARLRERGLA